MPSRVPDLVRGRPEPAPGAQRRGWRRAVATAALAVVPVVLAAVVLLPDLAGLDHHLPFAVFAALRPLLTAAGVPVANSPHAVPIGRSPTKSPHMVMLAHHIEFYLRTHQPIAGRFLPAG